MPKCGKKLLDKILYSNWVTLTIYIAQLVLLVCGSAFGTLRPLGFWQVLILIGIAIEAVLMVSLNNIYRE
mgnify:CR=1 FL=1